MRPLAEISPPELKKLTEKQNYLEKKGFIDLKSHFRTFEHTKPEVSQLDFDLHQNIFETPLTRS